MPDLSAPTAFDQLLDFSLEVYQWIKQNKDTLDEHFGENRLSPQPNLVNKSQPHFAEAVLSTLVRYELITKYAQYVKFLDIGCMLGGSLSYGKFFNLRQSFDSDNWQQNSDVDLLLVADLEKLRSLAETPFWRSQFEAISKTAEHDRELNAASPPVDNKALLFGLFPLIQTGSQYLLTLRAHGELTHNRVILSKKFHINFDFEVAKVFEAEKPRFTFPLSVHFASKDAFACLTNPLSVQEWTASNDPPVALTDLRIDSRVQDFMICHTLGGIAVPESESKITRKVLTFQEDIAFGKTKADLEICELPAYFYWEGRFVAGMYQNLILPNFEVLKTTMPLILERGI